MEQEVIYRLHLIYKVVFDFIRFRGFKIEKSPMSLEEFSNAYEKNYVIIADDENKFNVILLDDDSDYAKATKIDRILAQIVVPTVIVTRALSKHKTIKEYITRFNKLRVEKNKPELPPIQFGILENFEMNLPTHVKFTRYAKCTKEEAKRWLEFMGKSQSDLPIVLESDPMMVWHGFNSGDIVIEMLPSPNAGIAKNYKRVL